MNSVITDWIPVKIGDKFAVPQERIVPTSGKVINHNLKK